MSNANDAANRNKGTYEFNGESARLFGVALHPHVRQMRQSIEIVSVEEDRVEHGVVIEHGRPELRYSLDGVPSLTIHRVEPIMCLELCA